MTEVRWRTLIEVADTGSIRAAAGRLYVTESAVSSAVASLSREVGAQLIERVGRGVRLTPVGECYVQYLRRVVGLLEEAAAAVRGGADPRFGLLRVAAVTTAADQLVPRLLGRFRARYPEVDVRLEAGAAPRMWQLFDNRAVDVVVAGQVPAGTSRRVAATRPSALVLVGSAELAAGFDPATTPWLLREAGSEVRVAGEAVIARLEAGGPVMTLGSSTSVVAAAVAGLGVTLATEDSVQAELEAGYLRVLPVPGLPLVRPWQLVMHHDPAPVAELFGQFVRSGGDGGRPPWQGSEPVGRESQLT